MSSITLSPPVSGLNICPNDNNTVIFYWDELHNKAGGEKGSGRMICAAAHLDPATGLVSYGASVFHKQDKHENFVKKSHRKTAKSRLEKCPATFQMSIPDAETTRSKWLKEMRTNDELFDEVMERLFPETDRDPLAPIISNVALRIIGNTLKTNDHVDRKILAEDIVAESHVRDYVIATLKREVRKHIALPGGTKGERIKKVAL